MTQRVATYTSPEGGRKVYYRAGVPFPHGVAVTLDAERLGAHGMRQIEEDPRLKVSDVDADTVREAAATDLEMTADEAEAYVGRLLALFPALPEDAFTKSGTPRVPAVRDALPEADRPLLTAELIDRAWARRAPATQPLAPPNGPTAT